MSKKNQMIKIKALFNTLNISARRRKGFRFLSLKNFTTVSLYISKITFVAKLDNIKIQRKVIIN